MDTTEHDALKASRVDGVLALRGLAIRDIERAKAYILRHRGCCCANESTILVVGALVHNTLVTGARVIALAELEPMLAARCPTAWDAVRQAPPPGRVHLVLFSGDSTTAMISEPIEIIEQATAPTTNAPGGVS